MIADFLLPLPLPLPLPSRLPCLHLPERILPTRPQRPRKTPRDDRHAIRHPRIRLLRRRLHPRTISILRRRQRPLPGLLRNLRRAQGCRRLRVADGEAGGIVIDGLEVTFAEIVAAFEDGAGPFAQEAFGLAFDVGFGFLGFGVEVDDFADPGGFEGFLFDGQFRQGGKEVALDVVGGEGAVGQGFEEEAHAFEQVVVRIDDGRFGFAVVAVEERGHFRQHTELVHGWSGGFFEAGVDVGFGGGGHAVAKFGDFFIDLVGDVLHDR